MFLCTKNIPIILSSFSRHIWDKVWHMSFSPNFCMPTVQNIANILSSWHFCEVKVTLSGKNCFKKTQGFFRRLKLKSNIYPDSKIAHLCDKFIEKSLCTVSYTILLVAIIYQIHIPLSEKWGKLRNWGRLCRWGHCVGLVFPLAFRAFPLVGFFPEAAVVAVKRLITAAVLTLTLTSSNYYMSPLSLSACFSHWHFAPCHVFFS